MEKLSLILPKIPISDLEGQKIFDKGLFAGFPRFFDYN